MKQQILCLVALAAGLGCAAEKAPLFTCTGMSSSGTVAVGDGDVRYEHTADVPDARFSQVFDFPAWETNAYILMPACAYNGNRDARQKPDGLKPSGAAMPDGIGLEPVLYHPEYPCLNPDGSGEIEVLSGDMSVPIVGVYFREKKKGFFLFTEQQIGDRNLGYSVKSGSIRVDFPGNRKKAYLLPNNVDPPLRLKKGDRLTARFRTLEFAADTLPAFLERFFRERKSFLGDRHAPNGYTKELWDMVEKCWNEKLFVGGAYRQERWKWEPGWTGGPVSVYPLYQLGTEQTKARCRETLDFLVRHQAKSGLYYGCIVGEEHRTDGSGPMDYPRRTFVRRSPEALYFLIRCARMMGWKESWRASAQKCADALVRIWKRYGQFGQWIDVETGDLIVGRSTSPAIVSAALLEAWREFKVPAYREIAFAACEDYCKRDLDRGVTYGGPGDILMTPDSESAFGLLESCVALAVETKDPHWIARARQAAALASTWVVSYRYKFPPTSAFAKLGVNTVGSVWASCRNKHSAPGICTLSGDSLLKLYRLTKDEAYLELCKDIAYFLPQVVARPDRPILVHPEIRHRGANLEPGFMCERVNMSDWEHYDWIGEVYNHPCWCGTCLTSAYADLLTQPEFKEESTSPLDEFRGWDKKILTESVDIGAFENGSFEDGSKYGKVNKNGEIGRYGVNGGGGLKISNIDRSFGYGLKLQAPLKKGVRYIFSADVRIHGMAFGRLAMDGHMKATRKPSTSAWHTNYGQKDADGWCHESVEVVAEYDPELINYNFIVYCGLERGGKPGPENFVEVDNIKIESAAPKWYFCNVWPVHNQIYADEGRIRFNSSFYGEFFQEGAKPVYVCELVGRDGLRAVRDGDGGLDGDGGRDGARPSRGGEGGRDGARPSHVVCVADENGNFTADFGTLDYAGPATLRVTLYDRATRLNRGSRTLDLTVCVPERDKRLFVKENGVVLKDGKPFMPLGFYTGFGDRKLHDLADIERHLKRLHEAGFDSTMDYSSYQLNGKYRDDFYALYDKYGMWMLADDFKVWVNDPKFDEKFVGWTKRAEQLAKYPCIIGFYTMDENPEEAVPRLARLRRMLNEVAPGRMVNICNINRPEPYLPACDIPGGDNYPIGPSENAVLWETHRRLSVMQRCSDPAPVWWAPQCFNWATMKPGALTNAVLFKKVGREPTHEENLSVALCNVADGAKGFFFYGYFDLIRCPVPEYREQRWNSMCEIAKVLRRLEPFIMSGERIVELPHVDRKDETLVKALADGKGRYRVIVCGLRKQHETTFRLPPEYGNLKPFLGNAKSENGQWVFRGKDFSCDLFE